MTALGRFKTLCHLTLSPIRGDTHRKRLESFYRPQADEYDSVRERMLHGREELFTSLPVVESGTWVDLGAGTGRNAERLGPRLARFNSVMLVDLSDALLAVAKRRIADARWDNVSTISTDATKLDLPSDSVAN